MNQQEMKERIENLEMALNALIAIVGMATRDTPEAICNMAQNMGTDFFDATESYGVDLLEVLKTRKFHTKAPT